MGEGGGEVHEAEGQDEAQDVVVVLRGDQDERCEDVEHGERGVDCVRHSGD